MTDQPPSRDSNPFATCWTRPGALPWVEVASPSVDAVVARLEASEWRGQIVGPHGSGKSSLLRALEGPARVSGREPAFVAAELVPARGRGVLLFVEGFESVSHTSQRRQLNDWREDGLGFVVTTHSPLPSVPVVAMLGPSEPLVERLFQELTAWRATPVISDEALASWRRRRGNLRDVWFDLYDLHEKLTRPSRTFASVQAYSTPSV